MTIQELAALIDGAVQTKTVDTSREVTCGYCCDLLSWVMAKGREGMAWATVQAHMNVVAVAVLAAVLCLTAAFAVSPTLRSKALHWAAKVFPTHTELRLNPDAAPANGQTYEPVVNWLPVGLTLEEQRSDRGFSNYHYTDSDGCWLDVELLLFSSGGVMSLDTENADVRETVISGYPAITIHKEGVSVAACTLEDLNAILLVTGQGFSVDDVVRVAESVRLQ